MGRDERLRRICRLLKGSRFVRRAELMRVLEVSPATLKRDIQFLRDRLNAPIEWNSDVAGWQLNGAKAGTDQQFELPGLWLNAEEIHALLTMQHLLAGLDGGGILGPHIAPLMHRLSRLLEDGVPAEAEVGRRIRVRAVGARRLALPHFQAVGTALLQRQRLSMDYFGRSQGSSGHREVSPQRLVHYRDNWYLDAWCHQRESLRTFSVDAIQAVRVLDCVAVDIPESEVDAALGAGYGIFAGGAKQWALLRFTPRRARWVAAERWHADQLGRWAADGHWLLSLPYNDPRELVMDILRHVPDVEVIAPEELRDEVLQRLRLGLKSMGVDE